MVWTFLLVAPAFIALQLLFHSGVDAESLVVSLFLLVALEGLAVHNFGRIVALSWLAPLFSVSFAFTLLGEWTMLWLLWMAYMKTTCVSSQASDAALVDLT